MSAKKVTDETRTAVRISAGERLLGQVVADALRDLIGGPASVDLVDRSSCASAAQRSPSVVIDLDDVDIAITIDAGDRPGKQAAFGPTRVDSLDQLARIARSGGGTPLCSADRQPIAHGSAAGHLTDRELEVLTEMRRGAANASIAAVLGISVHTVRSHVGSIMRKLGTRSRVEAITRSH